jgi:exopolysaccharide production protein ExoQ
MTALPDARRRRHGRSRSRASPDSAPGRSATKPPRARAGSPQATTRSWIRPLDWEGWLAVFILLHGARAFEFLLGGNDAALPVGTGVWLLLYLGVFGLFWHHYRLRWLPWLVRQQPLLCAVLAIAAASYFWSIAPEFTWKRSTHLLGSTLVAAFIGYHFAPRTLMAILFYVFVILIVGSILFALAVPEIGQSGHGASAVWHGLTNNRNQLGFIAAIAAVFFIVGALLQRLPAMVGLALAAASILALAMTRSATATVVLVIGLLAVAIFLASKRIGAPSLLTLLLVLVAGSGIAIFVATSQHLYDVTELLGRDATLTHRTEIWAAAWQATLDRPWLGWGYGALWSVTEESAFVSRQLLSTSWAAVHAHNGFLNVASELGLPAGVMAVGWLLTGLVRATQAYIRRTSPFYLFAIAFSLQMIVENISESFLFAHRELAWMLIVTIVVAVQRVLQSADAPRQPKRAG